MRKLTGIVLSAALVGSMASVATVQVSAADYQDQYRPFTTLGVIGGFNEWTNDVVMTDDDGDGIYEAEITATGEFEFKIRADGEWNYSWAAYETDYDRTQNSQTSGSVSSRNGEEALKKIDQSYLKNSRQRQKTELLTYKHKVHTKRSIPGSACH